MEKHTKFSVTRIYGSNMTNLERNRLSREEASVSSRDLEMAMIDVNVFWQRTHPSFSA